MGKNQKIVLAVIILVLIFGGFFYFLRPKKEVKVPPPPEEVKEIPKELPPIFSFGAEILEVNSKENYLIIKPMEGEWPKEKIKVILSPETKIVSLKLPFDPKKPPPEGTFKFEQEEIKAGDLKVGNQILIRTSENIVWKSEFDDVTEIQVMP
jgi:virulence-associated protein VagC